MIRATFIDRPPPEPRTGWLWVVVIVSGAALVLLLASCTVTAREVVMDVYPPPFMSGLKILSDK